MKKILAALVLMLSLPVAIADEETKPKLQQVTDHIFLKQIGDKPGYEKIAGEVESVTRNQVLFSQDGTNATYLYTRDEVRRIELGQDDIEDFGDIVADHWSDKDIPRYKSGKEREFIVELIVGFLPGAVVTGFLVLVGLYFLASTLLQAYQRFVLEGNIKRLNTEKLLSEIDKLRFEVLELRQRLGLSVSEQDMFALEERRDQTEDSDAVTAHETKPPASLVGLPEIRLPEFHFIKFVKTRVLNIRTPEEFESRKQKLANYWEAQTTGDTGWFKFKYLTYNSTITVAIWIGWIFALALVGNIVGYFADPSYREIFGGTFFILVTVSCTVLIVAVIRLGQKRKLRRAAYQQAFNINVFED